MIIEDIKGQFSNKLQLFEEISLKNSKNSEVNKNYSKFCKKGFSAKSSLITHIKNVHSSDVKILRCTICDLKFFQTFFLEAYMKTKHPAGKDNQFECDFDGKSFKTKNLLYTHMLCHLQLVE